MSTIIEIYEYFKTEHPQNQQSKVSESSNIQSGIELSEFVVVTEQEIPIEKIE